MNQINVFLSRKSPKSINWRSFRPGLSKPLEIVCADVVNMSGNLLGEDSIFNLYISKESWEDVKLYKGEYINVIKQRELHRIPFSHRSPQFYCRNNVIKYIKNFAVNKQLTHCTLHLTIYLLDIFMDNHSITPERMLLVANVCILLAAKLEENNLTIPKINELNSAIKNAYPTHDYKVLEILILQFFHWYIMFPTAAHYTHYFLQAALCKEDFIYKANTPRSLIMEMHIIIRNYLDKIIEDVHYMQCYKPSMLASAIISLARKEVGLRSWTEQLRILTNYCDYEIEDTRLALLSNLPLHCKDCVHRENFN